MLYLLHFLGADKLYNVTMLLLQPHVESVNVARTNGILFVSLFALSIAEISWALRCVSSTKTLSIHSIHPFLRPLCKCTGHSLGGALALLASWQIQETHRLPHLACYTFGAPRPGNAPFARSYQQLVPDTWNVINDRHAFSQCLMKAAIGSSCAELFQISKWELGVSH